MAGRGTVEVCTQPSGVRHDFLAPLSQDEVLDPAHNLPFRDGFETDDANVRAAQTVFRAAIHNGHRKEFGEFVAQNTEVPKDDYAYVIFVVLMMIFKGVSPAKSDFVAENFKRALVVLGAPEAWAADRIKQLRETLKLSEPKATAITAYERFRAVASAGAQHRLWQAPFWGVPKDSEVRREASRSESDHQQDNQTKQSSLPDNYLDLSGSSAGDEPPRAHRGGLGESVFNPFGQEMFAAGPAMNFFKVPKFALMAYKKAVEAVGLTYYGLLVIFIEALTGMGWCAYNTSIGFTLPAPGAGSQPKSGVMPHWLANYTTFVNCWALFVNQLDQAGGDPAMKTNMMSLQMTITTITGADVTDQEQWLVAAHFIVARVHDTVVAVDPTKLGAPISPLELPAAQARARPVMPNKKYKPDWNKQEWVPRGGGRGGRGNDRGRGRGGRGQDTKRPKIEGDDCPYHPGKGHTVWVCKTFLAVQAKQNKAQGAGGDGQG